MAMREKKQEHRLQLAAGRRGLKLVKNRHRGAAYCLRAAWNAACVVGRRPDGRLGLVYAQTGRELLACWLTLTEIERVLAHWNEPAPSAWGEPPSARGGLPYANYRRHPRRVRQGGERRRIYRNRLTQAPSHTSFSDSTM
jgi:hypothetical protein